VTAAERTLVTIVGAFTILLGLLVVSLASGLTRRRRDARVLLVSLIALSLVGGVVVLVADGGVTTFRVIDIVLSAAVIIVLRTGRAARFFARTGGERT
jgi:cation-transporting ATPase E